MRKPSESTCLWCGEPYSATYPLRMYCGRRCADAAHRGRRKDAHHLLNVDNSEEWREQRACAGMDNAVFFPAPVPGHRPREKALYDLAVEEARSVCGDCPVQQRCLDYAMANRIVDGIWGGTTEEERRRMLRRRDRGVA